MAVKFYKIIIILKLVSSIPFARDIETYILVTHILLV